MKEFDETTLGRVFFASDTHFGHKNIIKYDSLLYTSVEEMDADIVRRWNSVVGPDDVVFHLGDFAFSSPNRIRELVAQLNGRIVLVLGNHDREKAQHHRISDWKALGFHDSMEGPVCIGDRFLLTHEPMLEIPEGKVNVYGHVHSSLDYRTIADNSFCACICRHGMAPVSFDAVKASFLIPT